MKLAAYFSPIESLEERRMFAAVGVDLAIQQVNAPREAICISHGHVSGKPASVQLQNSSADSISLALQVHFFLSMDQTLDASARPSGATAQRTVTFRAGQIKSLTGLVRPPTDLAASSYYLFAEVELPPSAEANNPVALALGGVRVVHSVHVDHQEQHDENAVIPQQTAVVITDNSESCTPAPPANQCDQTPTTTEAPPPAETQPASDTQPATEPAPTTQPTTEPDPSTQPSSDSSTQPSNDDTPIDDGDD